MLAFCANIFGLSFPFDLRTFGGGLGTLVIDPADEATLTTIQRLTDIANGPFFDTVDVAQELGCGEDLLRATIDASPVWEFLDDDCQYFWKRPNLPPRNYSITGNAILTCLCKIFSATHRVVVSDLVDSVVRDRILRTKGDSIPDIPVPVLRGIAVRSGLFDVRGEEIVRKPESKWSSLGHRDAMLLRACVDCGRVVTSDVIHSRLVKDGLTQQNAAVTIAYSPFLIHSRSGCGPKQGIYKFVTKPEDVDLDALNAWVDAETHEDGHSTGSGSIVDMLVRIPISTRTRVSGKYYHPEAVGLDGEWKVCTGGGSQIGHIVVSNRTVTKLAPVISALELRKDDVLELRPDFPTRVLYVIK